MTTNFKKQWIRDDRHLRFIRTLPCCVTGRRDYVQAAHIRLSTDGALGRKPSDCFVVPLSAEMHGHQHQVGENKFWKGRVDDAISLALSLFEFTGNEVECHRLIQKFISSRTGSLKNQ